MDLSFLSEAASAFVSGKHLIATAVIVMALVRLLQTDFVLSKFPSLANGWRKWVSAIVVGSVLQIGQAIIAGVALGGFYGILILAATGAQAGLMAAGLVKGVKEFQKPADPVA